MPPLPVASAGMSSCGLACVPIVFTWSCLAGHAQREPSLFELAVLEQEVQVAVRLHAAGVEPMGEEEIVAEVKAARAECRAW